jgi:hypothetical protein
MSNRFVYSPKRAFRSEDFSVVLIHSEVKKGAPHGLIPNQGAALIHSQLKAIKEAFGDTVDIVVVNGYKSLDLEKELNRQVRIVTNELYESTDIAHSIYLGIKNTTSRAVYLIDGSYVFDEKIFKPKVESHVYTYPEGDTGLILDEDKVVSMSYGLGEPKLGKIIYFASEDVKKYLRFYSKNLLLYEIFNLMIDNGSQIWTIN